MIFSNSHNDYRRILLYVLTGLFFFLTACGSKPEVKVTKLNKEAKASFNKSDYRQAIQKWQIAVKIPTTKPLNLYLNMADAWLRLAEPYMAYKTVKEAARDYQGNENLVVATGRIQLITAGSLKALATINNLAKISLPKTYILKGDIWAIQGQLLKAEAAYKKAIAIAPQNAMAIARLALCYLGLHNESDAKLTYDKLTEAAQKRPEILNQMGIFWRLKGNYKRAEFFLKKAASLDSGNLLLKKSLAEFYFINNRPAISTAIIIEALKIAPTSPTLNNFLIETLLEQNKLPEAATIINELSDKGSKDIIFQLLQGKYHLLNNEPYLSVSQFSEAIKNEPKLAISHYLLALAYLANQRPGLAEQSAIEALTLNPNYSSAELLLADINYQNGDFKQAGSHVNRLLIREPENFRPQLLKGCILLAQKKYKEALNHFRKAAILSPSANNINFFSALAVELSGETEEAISLYQKMLEKDAELPVVQRYIQLLEQKKSADSAISNFIDQLPPSINKSTDFQNMFGTIYLENRQYDIAKAYFNKSIQLDINQTEAYLGLAKIYAQDRDWHNFVKVLQKCLNKNPGDISTILKLAEFYDLNEQYESARTIVETGIKIRSSESPLLLNTLAWLILEENTDLDRAFLLAQKSYEKSPQNPAVLDTLGWAYYKKGIFTRAEWLLEEALQKSANQPIIHLHLGQTLLARGEKAKALSHLKTSLGLNPPPKYRQIAENILKTVKDGYADTTPNQ